WASPANLMRSPSERYLPRNGPNGRRALQAHDAGRAHENRLLDVRDGASHHRVFAASQPDAPRAPPCVRQKVVRRRAARCSVAGIRGMEWLTFHERLIRPKGRLLE